MATHATSVTQTAAPLGQPTVMARLQGLFPAHPPPLDTAKASSHHQRARIVSKPLPKAPKFMKVRIVTWNMHDSLPKGDLEELLGAVPPHAPQPLLEEPIIPLFSDDDTHPYHIVIVAGQECPTSSGIPMGLGAGFKLKEPKEKEREKENIKKEDKPERHKSKKHKSDEEDDPDVPSGWTSILEDWFCNGSGIPINTTDPPSSPGPSQTRHMSTGHIPERVSWKGPYQPLIKERMMGLYLTVFIHRDMRSLVRGTSKSAVTAGLIGGRVGNKGGVGISLNIDGTTMLLINAHLTAHEGKVPHRLANLAKIKAELNLDDFLRPDDPRTVSEDITDKFDYTFLCGDLNFRLDLSRLHADWLISRQDYAQALAFDQLRNLMRNGLAFVGFNEGPIDFAPTFKYDVLRTIKRPKTKGARQSWKHHAEKHKPLFEVEEREKSDDDGDEDGEANEGASLASSVWTSIHSRPPTDPEDEDVFVSSASSPVVNLAGGLAHKISIAAAAHKAKAKWMTLISSTSTPSPKSHKRKSMLSEPTSPTTPIPIATVTESTPVTSNEALVPMPDSLAKNASPDSKKSGLLRPNGPIRSLSSKSAMQSGDEETDDEDRGVYDSSNKKRVPSWCDRILWKSTVHPDPEDVVGLYRPRTRVGQFFINAFRPRSRRGSTSSTNSSESHILPAPPKTAPLTQTFTEALYTSAHRSRSNDVLPSVSNSPISGSPSPATTLSRPSSHKHDKPLRRSSSAGLPRSRKTSASSIPATATLSPSDSSADIPPPLPPKDTGMGTPSRWRFLQFLNRDPTHTPTELTETPTITADSNPGPKKGDVLCLSYNTLDDRGMRRLEGRSDHRPVIGSYAVYI